MEFASLPRNKTKNKKLKMVKRASIGADLDHLDADKFITTDPKDYNKRRTLKLVRRSNSWGFTLQTYGIKHKKTREIEIMTYVDYVEIGGAAWIAGMRAGDVILSVNGERVDHLSHKQLVVTIRQVQDTLRLVVLFEDCCRKVDLHERYLKLKAVLRSKFQELKDLEMKEMQILDNFCKTKGINRFEVIRQSVMSNVSSNSDSWDAYSMISSPHALQSTGGYHNHGYWSSVSSLKSFSVEDNNSSLTGEDYMYIDSSSDTDSLGLPVSAASHGHSSDSELPSTTGKKNRLTVKHIVSCSSDSALNKTDIALHKAEIIKEPHHKRIGHQNGNLDEVFINGATDKGSNSRNVVKGKGDNLKGAKSDAVDRKSSKLTNQNAMQDNQIYYAGDNGNIIVPKIVIEGDEIFTTFDHIDTTQIKEEDIPDTDFETYRDKVVALEIAREMALIENINKVSVDESVKNGTFDMVTRSPPSDRSEKTTLSKDRPSSLELPPLPPAIKKSYSFGSRKTASMLDKSPGLSPRSFTSKLSGKSPSLSGQYMSFSSSTPHICGSMSYDELKSSIPDFVISFHTDSCQVIYINEKDETTQL